MRWLDSITDWMDINLGELWEMVRDSKPGVLQSIGSQGVKHNLATEKQEGHTTAGRSEPSCPLCPDHHIQLHCTKKHGPACGPQMEQSEYQQLGPFIHTPNLQVSLPTTTTFFSDLY